MMAKIDSLLYKQQAKVTEMGRNHLSFQGHTFVIAYSQQVNFSKAIRTYEIASGSIYMNRTGGWAESKRGFAHFERRIYKPYKTVEMSLAPTDKNNSSKLVMTHIDFTSGDEATLQQQLAAFYLAAMEVNYELPFDSKGPNT